MKQKSKLRKKRVIIILLSFVLCTALVMTGLMIYGKSQMAKVPGLTFREALEYATQGKKDAGSQQGRFLVTHSRHDPGIYLIFW